MVFCRLRINYIANSLYKRPVTLLFHIKNYLSLHLSDKIKFRTTNSELPPSVNIIRIEPGWSFNTTTRRLFLFLHQRPRSLSARWELKKNSQTIDGFTIAKWTWTIIRAARAKCKKRRVSKQNDGPINSFASDGGQWRRLIGFPVQRWNSSSF